MNKIMKMWLCTMLMFVLSSSLAMAAELEETQEEKKKTEAVTGYSSLDDKEIRELIAQMTEAESQQDWNRYPDFWCSYNKEEWKELFASDTFLSDCRGVATVRSADIVVLEEISEDNILPFFKTDENYVWCTEWKAYFAGIDYTVADVNGYFHNGVNYFVFALGKENGAWKVIGKSEAPVELLESVYSTNYILEASQEDPVAIEFRIRHARQHGLVMDSDGRIYQNLTANENAVREFESCQNRRGIIRDCEHVEYAMIRVQGYSAPIALDHYLKVNLFSELIVSDKRDNAFMAQMVASKQVAMYYAHYYRPFISYGYDITTKIQAYDPKKYATSYASYVDDLYNTIKHLHMESEAGKTFMAHYVLDRDTADDIIEQPCMIQEEIVKMPMSTPVSEILDTYYKNVTQDGVYVGNLQLVAYANYSGWKEVGDIWYYYNSQTHYPYTGWKEINNLWYYFQGDQYGAMKVGWFKDGNTWYYLGTADDASTEGAMFASRWKEDPAGSGTWYYLQADGAMAANVTLVIDGVRYTFNSSGVWVK